MALTEAELEMVARAKLLAREQIAPHAATWEREQRIGHEALAQAAALGLTSLQVPLEHGGLGLGFGCKAAVAEALAGADFGFTMSLINTQNVAAVLARFASPELAARYIPDLMAARRLGCTALTEPGAGSDFAAITSRATRCEGGWRIDGAKAWITNAVVADIVVLYAQTEPGSGGRGIAAFLIDGQGAGFIREPTYALGGQHTIGTGGFRLEGYVARDDEVLHQPGQAFRAALASINQARTYIAAMCCGMVAQCLDIVRAYGESRSSFGRTLADHQGWRWRVAQASTELSAACLMVDRAVQLIEQGDSPQLEAAQAKLFAGCMAERQIPVLAHAMGAEGLREHYPFARHQQGARVAGFVDGSNEMLLERICAVLRA